MIDEDAVDRTPHLWHLSQAPLGRPVFQDGDASETTWVMEPNRARALPPEPFLGRVLRRLGHRSGEARTDRKVTRLRSLIALREASEGEHLQAGQLGFGGCQAFPFAPRDVRDGTQDDRGGDGQFDGQGWQPEEALGCS